MRDIVISGLLWKLSRLNCVSSVKSQRDLLKTMESGPQYFYILQSFVFSRENSKLSSVLSVLSCYITCIAHTFHINGL